MGVCVCRLHLLYQSSLIGHLGCFHILAIVNNAAAAIGVHISFRINASVFFLINNPGTEFLDCMVFLYLIF